MTVTQDCPEIEIPSPMLFPVMDRPLPLRTMPLLSIKIVPDRFFVNVHVLILGSHDPTEVTVSPFLSFLMIIVHMLD